MKDQMDISAVDRAAPIVRGMPEGQEIVARAPSAEIVKAKRGPWEELVETKRDSFKQMLTPLGIDPDRFCKQAVLALHRSTDQLARCDRNSILMSVVQGAELGLDFTPSIGEAYLVPYGTTCTFIPGYRGLMKLALRSPRVLMIDSQVVYKNDSFDWLQGTSPRLIHKPASLGTPRGDPIGVYAYAIVAGEASPIIAVLDKSAVEAVKRRARAKSGPWVIDEMEMWRKTAVRRLCKYLTPFVGSADLGRALEIGEDTDDAPEQEQKPDRVRVAVEVTGNVDPAHDKAFA